MSTPQEVPTRRARFLYVPTYVVEVAKLKLALDDKLGRPHDPNVVRIANAKRKPEAKAS